jgi:hypothetical protein
VIALNSSKPANKRKNLVKKVAEKKLQNPNRRQWYNSPSGFSLRHFIRVSAGGGLDAMPRLTHNQKVGGYHCHRGSLAGQSFSSKEEMLKKLFAEKADTPKKTSIAKH